MRAYIQAENLKYRHTALKALTILLPFVSVFFAAWLTREYFTVDSYNWWYMGLCPGMLAIICGIIGGKDKRKKNLTIFSLPCDIGKIWDAKVLLAAVLSAAAMLCITIFTIAAGKVMENILHLSFGLQSTSFALHPTIKAQIAAGFLIWLTTLWQIPFCLLLTQKTGPFFLLLLGAAVTGLTRPANYAEVILSKNEEKIRSAGMSVIDLIPDGCTYGIYSDEGTWLTGSFSEQERRIAWELYKMNRIYGDDRSFYRFIPMVTGSVCIVNYRIQMRYSLNVLNELLPAPELLGMFLLVIFFVLNMILLSRKFAKGLQAELGKLSAVTDKIRENDLEFEAAPSEIGEIHEVMDSLTRMKEALKDSLKKQWDMEKQKQEQLSALTHDIKTPLTVIRGNAELLLENMSAQEDKECASYILSNVQEMEQYLAAMRSVLHGLEQKTEQRAIGSKELEDLFLESARQIVVAEKLPVSFSVSPSSKEIRCCEERMLRAWSNLVSNGAEHTDPQKGIHVRLCPREKDGQTYLTAAVRDFGKGFTEKDLRHAGEEFYSGDASRHGRSHQGMGLFIAKQFLAEQGGFLVYQNCVDGMGAEVALWIACR